MHTPSSTTAADDAASPATTTATTPRARFPSDLKTLVCTWPGCPKTFNRPARLRDHLNSHTNSRPFACPYEGCGKDYTVDKHLKQHVKASHTNERRHVCPREGCGKSFVTGTRLKRHQAVHEGADRFRCARCGQSFRKRETLAKHVRKEHEGLKAYPCPEAGCRGVGFDTKASLRKHAEREHGELRFWCGECGLGTPGDGGGGERRVGFTTELGLQAHMKKEHQNCMFCDFKSASQAELESHVEMYHSGKTVDDRRTARCPHPGCGKRFTKSSNLKSHIKIAHEGLRFVCGEIDLAGPDFAGWSNDQGCGDKFCAKARLEDHVRYIHLGYERPKMSVAVPASTQHQQQPQQQYASLLDDVSGATLESKQTASCAICAAAFIRYADLDVHMHSEHPDTFDLGALLSSGSPVDDVVEGFLSGDLTWPDDDDVQEDWFAAAELSRTPAHDDWAEDEANILLLARDPPELDIDPALMSM